MVELSKIKYNNVAHGHIRNPLKTVGNADSFICSINSSLCYVCKVLVFTFCDWICGYSVRRLVGKQ